MEEFMGHNDLPFSTSKFISLKSILRSVAKGLLCLAIGGIAFAASVHADSASDEPKERHDVSKNWLDGKWQQFEDALRDYVAIIRVDGRLEAEQVSALSRHAATAAEIYFEMGAYADYAHHCPEMLKLVDNTISENSDREARFIFLKTAFQAQAEAIIKSASTTQVKGDHRAYTRQGLTTGLALSPVLLAVVAAGPGLRYARWVVLGGSLALTATGGIIGNSYDKERALTFRPEARIQTAQDVLTRYGQVDENPLRQDGTSDPDLGEILPASDENTEAVLTSLGE